MSLAKKLTGSTTKRFINGYIFLSTGLSP